MTTVKFGSRSVGDGHPCFVTYEAGPTHSGLQSAIELVRLAASAKADAVKFQILDPDRLCADKKQLFGYEVLVNKATGETKKVEEPLYDLLKRRSMSLDEWRLVKKAADDCGIAFCSTVGFPDEVDFLADIGCHSIKIASGDVNHHPLIRLSAETGACIQLDTGSSTLGEIEQAIDVCLSVGNSNIIVHQCPSGYPARLDSINLNIIPTLKQMFGLPVAYSDHTPGWEMDVAAIALGANLVEKTITFDRATPSIEHIFSLEPDEMTKFVQTVRDVETAMGKSRRILLPEEHARRTIARRSAFLAENGVKGQALAEVKFEFRRPGDGVGPDMIEKLSKRVLASDLAAGTKLSWSDIA